MVAGPLSVNLVDKIIVQSPFDGRKEHVHTLTTTSQEFAGYTFAEVLFVEQTKGRKDRAAQHFNEAQAVARLQDMETITAPDGAAMRQVTKGVTPGVRLSGGDEVRSVEARQRRHDVHAIENPGLHYGALGADSDQQPQQQLPARGAPVLDAATDMAATKAVAVTSATSATSAATAKPAGAPAAELSLYLFPRMRQQPPRGAIPTRLPKQPLA